MAANAKDDWQKAMTELAQEEPELLQHFQKLSEAAGKVGKAWRCNHSHPLDCILFMLMTAAATTAFYMLTSDMSLCCIVVCYEPLNLGQQLWDS